MNLSTHMHCSVVSRAMRSWLVFVGYRFACILHTDNTQIYAAPGPDRPHVFGHSRAQAERKWAHHSEIYFTRLVKWIACGAPYRSLMSFVLLFHLHPRTARSYGQECRMRPHMWPHIHTRPQERFADDRLVCGCMRCCSACDAQTEIPGVLLRETVNYLERFNIH